MKLNLRMTKPTKWHVRPAKTPISLGICPVWSESSLCVQWVAKDIMLLDADSNDSDQTGQMPGWSEFSLGAHAILLVLSCGGSITFFLMYSPFHHRTSVLELELSSHHHYTAKTASHCNLTNRNEPRHDKTNKVSVRPAKTQISLGIHPVWSESSLCAQWVAKDPSFLHADSEDSGQTGRMPRLNWVFAGRTLTLLVLSCCGSNDCYNFAGRLSFTLFPWFS